MSASPLVVLALALPGITIAALLVRRSPADASAVGMCVPARPDSITARLARGLMLRRSVVLEQAPNYSAAYVVHPTVFGAPRGALMRAAPLPGISEIAPALMASGGALVLTGILRTLTQVQSSTRSPAISDAV